MGYATVRAALVSYFRGRDITGITEWFQDAPWYLDGARWTLAAGQPFGAIAFPHLDHTTENRITVPAQAGNKQVDYTVSLVFQYQYLIPPVQPGLIEDAWVGGVDAIIDDLKTAIRADQTLGCGPNGPIFQAGETSPDITTDMDLPRVDDTNGGRIYTLGRVEFTVTEIIVA